jgi:hypothetical protein
MKKLHISNIQFFIIALLSVLNILLIFSLFKANSQLGKINEDLLLVTFQKDDLESQLNNSHSNFPQLVTEEKDLTIGTRSKDIDLIFDGYQDTSYDKSVFSFNNKEFSTFRINLDHIQILSQEKGTLGLSSNLFLGINYQELDQQFSLDSGTYTNYPYSDSIKFEIIENSNGVKLIKQYISYKPSGNYILKYGLITQGSTGYDPRYYEIRANNVGMMNFVENPYVYFQNNKDANFEELEKFIETIKLY